MNKDNSKALAEQEELVAAIAEDSVIAEIRSSSPLGASILAFNQLARLHGRKELSAQEWVEIAVPNGLLAMKRAWEYTAETRNLKAYAEEMRAIGKLFNVPANDHPKYMERMVARFEAEQNCRAKYGIQ